MSCAKSSFVQPSVLRLTTTDIIKPLWQRHRFVHYNKLNLYLSCSGLFVNKTARSYDVGLDLLSSEGLCTSTRKTAGMKASLKQTNKTASALRLIFLFDTLLKDLGLVWSCWSKHGGAQAQTEHTFLTKMQRGENVNGLFFCLNQKALWWTLQLLRKCVVKRNYGENCCWNRIQWWV